MTPLSKPSSLNMVRHENKTNKEEKTTTTTTKTTTTCLVVACDLQQPEGSKKEHVFLRTMITMTVTIIIIILYNTGLTFSFFFGFSYLCYIRQFL